MQTDVKSATATEGGLLLPFRARIKSIVLTTTDSSGSIVFKDGGSGGEIKIALSTPASADFHNILIPDQGVLFETDVFIAIAGITSVTVFYG